MPEPAGSSSTPNPRELRLAAVLTAALPLLVFWRVFVGEGLLLYRDVSRVSLPAKLFWRDQVLSGRFPEWFPYDGLGLPFVPALVSGALDPLNVLFLVFPPTAAMQVAILACYPVAALSVFALCRRFGASAIAATLGGCVYAMSGYLVGISVNLPYLEASALLPLALLAADRFSQTPRPSTLLLAAFSLCWILFAGDPQAFVFGCLLAAALILFRTGRAKRLWLAASLGASVVLLSAPQWLPSLLLLREATPGGLSASLGNPLAWSVHPLQLFDFFVGPLFDSSPSDVRWDEVHARVLRVGMDEGWVSTFFMGPMPWMLAALGFFRSRRTALAKFGLAALVFFLLLALGRHAYVYSFLHDHAPLFGSFRYPEKLVPFVALGVALAAAAGMKCAEGERDWRALALALGGFGLVVIAFGLLPNLWRTWLSHSADPSAPSALFDFAAQRFGASSLLVGISAVVTGVLVFFTPLAAKRWVVVGSALLLLLVVNSRSFPLVQAEVLDQPTAFIQHVLEDGEGAGPARSRVMAGSQVIRFPASLGYADGKTLGNLTGFTPSTPALFRVPGVSEYWPGTFTRALTLIGHAQRRSPIALKLASVRYVSVFGDARSRFGEAAPIAQQKYFGLQLYQLEKRAPRAFYARARCFPDAAATWIALQSGQVDGVETAALECAANPEGTGGSLEALQWLPGEVRLRARGEGGAVVLGDAFTVGWSATVDGQAAPVLPANLAFTAVAIAAGDHTVELRYRTPGLRFGAVCALFGLGALGVAEMIRRRRFVRAA